MLDLLKQRLASRTYRVATLLTLLTAIEAQAGFFLQWVPPAYHAWFLMIWPVAMLFCREITTTALSEK